MFVRAVWKKGVHLTNIVKNSTNSESESAGQSSSEKDTHSGLKSDSGNIPPSGGALGRLEAHVEKKSQEQGFTGWRRLAGMGFEFFGIVLMCALLGMWLDEKFKLGGMGALGGIVVGVVGGAYLQIRTILQNDKK